MEVLFKDRLGNMIRNRRTTQKITQEKLAERVNVTTSMIGQIERGETMPSIETLGALITQLDIDPKELFQGTPPKDSAYAELCTVIYKMNPSQRKTLLKIAKIIRDDCP